MSGRVLYRPPHGWARSRGSARRAEIALWLAWALVVVCSWASLNLLVATIEELMAAW